MIPSFTPPFPMVALFHVQARDIRVIIAYSGNDSMLRSGMGILVVLGDIVAGATSHVPRPMGRNGGVTEKCEF